MISLRLLVCALLLGLLSAALLPPMSGKRDWGVQKGVLRSSPMRGGEGDYEDLDEVLFCWPFLLVRCHW
jgi:hypothetical protein